MTTPAASPAASVTASTAPSTAAFGRALRRLDVPEAREFVADLLAARGYRTEIEGRVVTAESTAGRTVRLLVVDGVRSLADAGRADGVDAVVTAGGPAAAAVGALLARLAARRGDPPDRIGPATLREWLVYAVGEDDRTALTDRYLGATEPSAVERVAGAVAGGLAALAGHPGTTRPTWRAAAAVLLAVVAVAAVVVAGPLAPIAPTGPAPGGEGGAATTATRTATTTAGAAPATATPDGAPVLVGASPAAGGALPETCPLPPVGAHPSALRPTVLEGVSAGGLEGWELIATQNLSRYDFDPNDQQAGVAPEDRHIAVYAAPDGGRYRLRIDRWDSSSRARAAEPPDGSGTLAFAWGAYVVWVTWRTGESGRPSAEGLLADVTTAEGVKLGERCVAALLNEHDGIDAGDTAGG